MDVHSALGLFLDSSLVQGGSTRTPESYGYHIGAYIRYLGENNLLGEELLKTSVIERFLLHEENSGFSLHTVYGRYAALRRWFNWMISREEFAIDKNPVDLIHRQKPRVDARVASYQDVLAVMESISATHPDSWVELRDSCVFAVMLATGLRLEEMAGLMVADFDSSARCLWVRKGKGNKGRPVPISVEAQRALVQYVFNKPGSPWLWPSSGGATAAPARCKVPACAR